MSEQEVKDFLRLQFLSIAKHIENYANGLDECSRDTEEVSRAIKAISGILKYHAKAVI